MWLSVALENESARAGAITPDQLGRVGCDRSLVGAACGCQRAQGCRSRRDHWVRCVQCCDGGLGTRGRVTDQPPRDHRRSRRQFARKLRCVLGEGLSQVGSVATCAFANLVQVGTSSCVTRCKCSRQGGVASRFSSLVGLGRAERHVQEIPTEWADASKQLGRN